MHTIDTLVAVDDHDADCIVLRARALLTAQPAPDAAPRAELSEWDDLAALDD